MACATPLAWYDNIPLLSFALLRGRCRHCRTAIPWRYPLVEATTALLIAAACSASGSPGTPRSPRSSAPRSSRSRRPTSSAASSRTASSCPAAAVVLAAQHAPPPVGRVGARRPRRRALPPRSPRSPTPAGMGMGDVKLALLLGVALGRTVPVAMMIGMVAALVPSVVLLARHGSAARKMRIPFGPFLALGGVVALFAGHGAPRRLPAAAVMDGCSPTGSPTTTAGGFGTVPIRERRRRFWRSSRAVAPTRRGASQGSPTLARARSPSSTTCRSSTSRSRASTPRRSKAIALPVLERVVRDPVRVRRRARSRSRSPNPQDVRGLDELRLATRLSVEFYVAAEERRPRPSCAASRARPRR